LALKDKNGYLISQASEALTDPRAVAPLISALKDAEPSVRNNAAASLGTIRDIRAIEPLIDTLNDDTELERLNAPVTSLLDAAAALKTGKAVRWKVRDVSVSALKEITGQDLPIEEWETWWLSNREKYAT
jgi:HEAT repeat protein